MKEIFYRDMHKTSPAGLVYIWKDIVTKYKLKGYTLWFKYRLVSKQFIDYHAIN